MSEVRKIPRLGKAAGEFNVSISTIVSLLQKKNFDILENPNSKLTEEMYEILIKEFQGEKLVKEEAKKIDIGVYNKKNEESATSKEDEVAPTVIVSEKSETTSKNTETPSVPEKEVESYHVEIQKPKIVGSIDLDTLSSKKHRKEKETVKEEKVEISTPKEEEKVEIQPEVLPEVEKVEEVEKPEPIVEIQTKKPEPEHFETVVDKVEIKIIDKINLDEIGKKKHTPKEKEKEENTVPVSMKEESEITISEPVEPISPEPVETPSQTENVSVEEEPVVEVEKIEEVPSVPEEVEDVNFIKTVYTQIQAPVIKGKIDLTAFQKKETPKKDTKTTDAQANANDLKKKKKRARIKHPANKQSNEVKAKQAPAPKPEISEEDIQKQIRETMSRLEPLGKSKSSKRRREKRLHIREELQETEMQEIQDEKKLKVTEFLTADELATLMNVPVINIISTCMSIGLAVSINQRLDAETISLLGDEYGFEIEFVRADAEDDLTMTPDNEEDLVSRHPIITVMGHVDHGKTSLLDYIRKSNVIAGEAGGITQHIGAYEVKLSDGRKITFLDTPGHEAFTAMRARGAKVTDLCIIVIAADDSVMPQTIEAINHSQAAGVPMVFAITKIDKPNANPEKIRQELANMNILVEEWGGKYQCQEIDAKHGVHVEELLEKVLLEAEMLDLKANPNRNGIGTVLESSLDKGKGYVAKVLVLNGSIKVGDPVLAGSHFGKVKALYNEREQQVQSVGPASPILLLGLSGAPQAGDILNVCHSDHEARVIATKRSQLAREMGLRTQKHITLDEIGRRIAIGDFKELNIIVKGDVDGTVEALSDSLLKLSTNQVQVNVIHKSVGQVTESDVLLASASNAIIVAFQVRPSVGSRKLAEQEQIDIRTYSIIYTAINEIKDAIAGMHTPEVREKILCNIEIREVFKISKVGNIAGCMVLDGKLQRSTRIRLIRDGIVIYTGKLGSLKRFKDDAKEVLSGQDCGLNIENFNDIKVGDIIEGYEEYEVKIPQ